MGGKSSKGREEQARKLLTWGLRDFATVHLFSAGQSLGEEPVWYGENHRLPVGSAQEQSLSLPRSEADKLKAQYVINTARLEAPIGKGQTVGEIRISDNGGGENLAAGGAAGGAAGRRVLAPGGLREAEALTRRADDGARWYTGANADH